jgi:hypothetical protein
VRESPTDAVALYVAEVGHDVEIQLDNEHDTYAWMSLEGAVQRCLPPEVGLCLAKVASSLAQNAGTG